MKILFSSQQHLGSFKQALDKKDENKIPKQFPGSLSGNSYLNKDLNKDPLSFVGFW